MKALSLTTSLYTSICENETHRKLYIEYKILIQSNEVEHRAYLWHILYKKIL